NARRKFPDQIGVYNYPIDIHVYDTSDQQYARYSKEFRETGRMKPGESVGLPYGMIVPKGFKNLWVAGRCASMDVQVHGAFRVQPAAVMMGQAAGTAAVQSVRTKRSAAEIDTELLVETLRKAGAYLPQSATSKQMSRKTA
ncbi:MAG TPA: FAD-dependent oxidoreductase, partial [Bryobacteraceae bacterium]|nr:FAD-dependent oxidoreductase [Bryobacteraceae bacterium]